MTSSASPRQTLSYLQHLLSSRGIRPKNKLGQNFLIDLNLVDLVVRSAELTPADVVLEIGSGTGSLTGRLAETAGVVLSVEIDRAFHDLARQTIGGKPNVVLLLADVLRNKNHLSPILIETLTKVLERSNRTSLKLVANLPYAVATPVISNLLLSDFCFERMVVMVQWEIAERLWAQPDTKAYGALAVLVQSLADVEPVRRLVPPTVFWPRPKVASAIVCIKPNPAKRAAVGDPQRFRNFLRDLYTHRRKNLRGALVALPDSQLSKHEIDARLEELGLVVTLRAEDLDIDDHLRLCEVFGKRVAALPGNGVV